MNRVTTFLVFAAAFLAPTLALAAPAAAAVPTSPGGAIVALGIFLGVGAAAMGGALGQGRAAAAALEGICRNPNSAEKVNTPMLLGLAFIESLTIFTLVIAFLLLGKVVGPVVRGRGQFFIHERANALPRAFVAHSLEALEDDDAVLAAITARTLQPRRQAYVVSSELPTDVRATTPIEADRTVTFVRNDANHIEIEVGAGKTRHLVLADTYLPGWTATIDGNASEVIRCNHCQRLVVLPETACLVTFDYEPPGLMLALILMLLGTVSAIAAWWLWRRRQHREQEVA